MKIIRALWTGEHVKFKGKYWDVDAKLYDRPASPIPIYIAAGGPKSARMAGLYGDGLIGEVGPLGSNPLYKAAWEDGARESGKDPAKLPIMVELYAVYGGEKEARQSADLWHFGPTSLAARILRRGQPSPHTAEGRGRDPPGVRLQGLARGHRPRGSREGHREGGRERCNPRDTHDSDARTRGR